MYSEIAVNKRKTVVIMAVFVLLIVGLAWLFGQFSNSPGLTYGIIIGGLVYAFISYFAGSSMSLALNGAQEIQKEDNPRLWRTVENLSITNGMPMPRVFIIDDPAPNAFATGRDPNHSAVCATSGLLEMMTDNELEGVMAHELGHVKNYDIRVSMIAFALAAVVSLIADFILRMVWFRDNRENNTSPVVLVAAVVAAIIMPIVATMIQLAISRKREYLADATGALTTRYPEGLASALEKLEQYGSPLKRQNASTAHLFLVNPLKKGVLSNLFSTHPPIADRVARLRSMGTHA